MLQKHDYRCPKFSYWKVTETKTNETWTCMRGHGHYTIATKIETLKEKVREPGVTIFQTRIHDLI